jgi:hypothetical protein
LNGAGPALDTMRRHAAQSRGTPGWRNTRDKRL